MRAVGFHPTFTQGYGAIFGNWSLIVGTFFYSQIVNSNGSINMQDRCYIGQFYSYFSFFVTESLLSGVWEDWDANEESSGRGR